MTKAQQLKKNKPKNHKKLSKTEDLKFRKYIRHYIAEERCQYCGATGSSIHHPIYGYYGADRDMRCALLLCDKCHTDCHADKHGDKNKMCERIGHSNRKEYNQKEGCLDE